MKQLSKQYAITQLRRGGGGVRASRSVERRASRALIALHRLMRAPLMPTQPEGGKVEPPWTLSLPHTLAPPPSPRTRRRRRRPRAAPSPQTSASRARLVGVQMEACWRA